jgi:NAD(P)-dependent dehydrogenase (short-subunit alcohol dehydrogenase family)
MDIGLLNDKVALVTGAGRNIGRAIALALANAGAKVVVNVRASRDEGEAVANEIVARGGEALVFVADITQRAEVDAMVGAVSQRFGALDILVNNAAIRREVGVRRHVHRRVESHAGRVCRWRVSLHAGGAAAPEKKQGRFDHPNRRDDRIYGRCTPRPCRDREGGAGRLHARTGA